MDDIDILWPSPPAGFSLDWNSAHVWAFSLELSSAEMGDLAALLAPEERRRAESFRFDRDRNWYIAGRGTVRTILGVYLRALPATIALNYGSHGKPLLDGRFARSGLQFNLAHCENLALLAVTRGRIVGVDLERIRVMKDAQEMSACFCSPREKAEFLSLPPDERDAAFFRLWTRKEAWLKATGQGIGQSLDKVEVSFREDEPANFLHLPEEAGTPALGWTLQELTPAPGFVAALAMPGKPAEILSWQWNKKEQFEYAQT
jgi:4'-phosphopantetheinyl transferase